MEAVLGDQRQKDEYRKVRQAVERLLEIKALTPECGAGAS